MGDYRNKGKKDCGKEIDCAKCVPLSPCPKKILIECGTTGGTRTFTAANQTFDAASVTVDTSCFCKPITDLQFSSQVNAVLNPTISVGASIDAEVVLRYDLICRRDGGSEVTIGCWTFRRFLTSTPASIDANQSLETYDTFSFNKCICSTACQGCIDYFVRVTATTVTVDDNVPNIASATISMGQLTAKIQDC
ncbi:DUF4489 domain-containing protein [Wukongibacter baidiensis]|uniref:DUF4489 domain-containing protein n=1 Tax=Wukongibacter baidiensis TaxID=1723361 RepID=UPI003D7FB4AA